MCKPSNCKHKIVEVHSRFVGFYGSYYEGICLNCGADVKLDRSEKEKYNSWETIFSSYTIYLETN